MKFYKSIFNNDYRKRVKHQIGQFANKAVLKKLPPVYRYWTQKYLVPKIVEVFGVRSIIHVYRDAFAGALKSQGDGGKILSIGSGDGIIEVAIANELIKSGVTNFTILVTELSDIRLERAKDLVKEKSLEDYFQFKLVDINEWDPQEKFVGVMAQHTLHHIVELEKTFDFIDDNLSTEGVFVIVDMIGRNGHMRWPETLDIVEKIWNFMPEKVKFNHQFNKEVPDYINWDCSNKGFEGIRSQDILPLLCEKFSMSHFLGVGGFIDIFVERGYGHNFDVDDKSDTDLIDIMSILNDSLLETGAIKPTMIFAVARKKDPEIKTIIYKGLTPEAAIRRAPETPA